MNVFILTVDGDRDAYVRALDVTPIIRNWLAFLPNSVALATYRTIGEISNYLRTALPGRQFILVPAGATSSAGFLPGNVWNFINSPYDSGRHAPDPYAPPNMFGNLMSGLAGHAGAAPTLKNPLLGNADAPQKGLRRTFFGDKDPPSE